MRANTIVDGTEPEGDLDIDVSVGYESGDNGGSLQPDRTNDPIQVSESDGVAFNVSVTNNDSVGFGNDDNCNGGGGIAYRVVGNIKGVGRVTETECIADNGGGASFVFNYTDLTGAEPVENLGDGDAHFEFFVEGANTGLRVTPIYFIPIEIVQDGREDDPQPELSYEFVGCDVRRDEADPGEYVVAEGTVRNTSDVTIKIPYNLLVNGTETIPGGSTIVNLEPGETREFLADEQLPSKGEYEFAFALGQPERE